MTEMGGLYENIFGGIGRGMAKESGKQGVETAMKWDH